MGTGTVSLDPDVGVFTPDRSGELSAFFRAHGFAVLRGLWSEEEVAAIEVACTDAQARLVAGELPERYGTTVFTGDDVAPGEPFANYVTHVTEVSEVVRAAVVDERAATLVRGWLGDDCWLLEDRRFGVVYQDARPSEMSGYSRIGWHTDWQSGPNHDTWPSVAFTIHIDATSPANGFLRVVPGSHRWATPAPHRNVNDAVVPEGSRPWGGHTDEPPPVEMPLGFAKVPGELALYCERGDVLFHDAYLWHAAARATEDDAIRRHIRGGWYTGSPEGYDVDDFVKNAAR